MAKISEEEFDRADSEQQAIKAAKVVGMSLDSTFKATVTQLHVDIKKVLHELQQPADRDDRTELIKLQQGLQHVLTALDKPTPTPTVDLQPILVALQEELEVLKQQQRKPASFQIKRNRFTQMIEEIVPEY